MKSTTIKKKILPWIVILLCCGLLFYCFKDEIETTKIPRAVKGELDLESWDFIHQRPLPLQGEWEIYPEKFLLMKDFSSSNYTNDFKAKNQPNYKLKPHYIQVPSSFDSLTINNKPLSNYTYATFRLKVLLQSPDILMGLKLKTIGTAFRLFINDKEMCRVGTPGTDRSTSMPWYKPQTIFFLPGQKVLNIIVHVSNFHHRFGGIWENIYIGSEPNISQSREKTLVFQIFLFGTIFIMGLYHIGLYLIRKKDASSLYFGIFCTLMAARTLVTGEQYFIQIFPNVSWELLRKIEYTTIYLGLPIFCMFIYQAFDQKFSKTYLKCVQLFYFPLFLLTWVTPLRVYSLALQPAQTGVFMTGIYIIYFLISAVQRHQEGAIAFLIGTLVLFISITNDILNSNMIIQTVYWTPFGFFIFIFSQAILLSIRFTKAFYKVEELSVNLGRMIHNSPVGIFKATPDGQFITANPALAKIYQYHSPAELITTVKNIGHELYVQPDARSHFRELIEKNGVVRNFECQHYRKDGHIIDISINAYVIRNEKNNILYYEGLLEDITEKKRALQLEVAKKAAENANKTKSEFLANMSHEIRTPMNGVIGMNSLLLETELTHEQKEYAEIVKFSSEALLVLLNDILDFSKVEAGKMELEIINFDIRKIVEDVAELMSIKAEEKAIEFGALIHHNVPSLLKGDPTRLRQVLLNLAGNALKFTEKGSVFIKLNLLSETNTHVKVRFDIEDTGIGISEEGKKRLFHTFSQADSSTTRRFGGTGLGLAISKKLVEMMNGDIQVDSQEGSGSTFWFTAQLELQEIDKNTSYVVPADIQNKKILIVDDIPINIEILEAYLKHVNCKTQSAFDATEAFERLNDAYKSKQKFDAVIVDYMMPKIDGQNFGQQIRAEERFKDLKLIMLSSRAIKGDAKKIEDLGFDAFLTKPIKRNQLIECLQTVFGYVTSAVGDTLPPPFITQHTIIEAKRKNTRILLAEDNKVNQILALKYLTKFGFQADCVENGRKAVDALKKTRYSIVLMDVQMPEMNGLEATRAIRNTDSNTLNKKTPIIAMTAHAMKEDRERCLQAGMDDYISKPINPQHLLEKIEQYMNLN